MTEMVAPAWMHEQVTAEQYASWTAEQCSGIEIVDGMVLVSPGASKRQSRLARFLANALDGAAGPEWNADTDFDVRLQDVPLNNRRPEVTVYRAETIDVSPTRPEDVLLVVEVVSPGSETTDRVVKADQYAKAEIPFYWRVEQAVAGPPLVYTHVLDPAVGRYREGEVFTGVVRVVAPFAVRSTSPPSDRHRHSDHVRRGHVRVARSAPSRDVAGQGRDGMSRVPRAQFGICSPRKVASQVSLSTTPSLTSPCWLWNRRQASAEAGP